MTQQQIYEVWEYGYGESGRFRFAVNIPEDAIDRFLQRQIISGYTFREYVRQELGYKQIKLCVKDPRQKGTQKKPNYPKVVDVDLRYEKRGEKDG